MSSSAGATGEAESLPCIAIRNRVLFPGSFVRLFIGRDRSVALVKARLWDERKGCLRKDAPLLGVFTHLPEPDETKGNDERNGEGEGKGEGAGIKTQEADTVLKQPAAAHPGGGSPPAEERDVYMAGVAARVTDIKRAGKDANYAFTLIVEGVRRVRMLPPESRDAVAGGDDGPPNRSAAEANYLVARVERDF